MSRTTVASVPLLLLAGCVRLPMRLDNERVHGRLPAPLIADETTRADVVRGYGSPSARFDNDALWTYRLRLDPDTWRYVLVSPANAESDRRWRLWMHGDFSLVLVFEADRLRDHALVQVR